MTGRGRVRFRVPAAAAFDYLADPRHRPQWQPSLARVGGVTGEPRVGQRWVDVTRLGLRPQMETVVHDRPHRWAERGSWRTFTAWLELRFEPAPGGCVVAFELEVAGRGVLRPLGVALSAAAVPAVRADLRRAARALAAGVTGE